MPTDAKPFTDGELEHLRTIRVCGCDGSCTALPNCPEPILDGIGADWIEDHFDSLIATFRERDARIDVAVTALTMIRDGCRDAFPDEIAARALEAMK